jgi:hypothetical protein
MGELDAASPRPRVGDLEGDARSATIDEKCCVMIDILGSRSASFLASATADA